MIRIKCDETFIDENYYIGIERKGQLYSDNFRLGATLCEEYNITLDMQGVSAIPETIELYEDDTKTKTLLIDSYEVDGYELSIHALDYMIKGNIPYDASLLMVETGKTTLGAILDDICVQMGVTNGVGEFYGQDLEVSWYNNQISARDYVGYIAEMNASFAYITADNELKFKAVSKQPELTIDFEELSDYKIGHKHSFTRVVWDDSNNKWEFGDETGDTYYINTANVYVLSEADVEFIYNQINGLEFYNFTTENCPLNNIAPGTAVSFENGAAKYLTFAQFVDSVTYTGGEWFGGVELDVTSEAQQETQLIDNDKIIKHLQTIVDRNNNQIIQVVTETTNLANKVAENETNINNNQQEVIGLIGGLATEEQLVELETTMQTKLDAYEFEISSIKTTIDEDGVKKVTTTSGTFDENGLTMEKTGAKTKTTLNEDGVNVKDTQGVGEDLLFAGYVDEERAAQNDNLKKYEGQSIVYSENLIVDYYVTIGKHSRMEDYEDGTGIFYIE